MLWIYRRDNEKVRVETRLDTLNRKHVIRIVWPDGRDEAETFSDHLTFRRRLAEFQSQLREQNWIGLAGPSLSGDREQAPPQPGFHERREATDRRRFTRQDRRQAPDPAANVDRLSPPDVPSDEET